jgi:hypothetical protein
MRPFGAFFHTIPSGQCPLFMFERTLSSVSPVMAQNLGMRTQMMRGMTSCSAISASDEAAGHVVVASLQCAIALHQAIVLPLQSINLNCSIFPHAFLSDVFRISKAFK